MIPMYMEDHEALSQQNQEDQGYSELGYSYKFLFLPNLLRAIRGDTRRANFVNFIFSAYSLWIDTRGTVSYQMYELANKFLSDPWDDAGEEETLGGGEDMEFDEDEEEQEDEEEREDEGIGEESEDESEMDDEEEADNDEGAVSNDEIEIEEAGYDERMAIINAIRGNGRFGEPPMSVEEFEELQEILRHRFEGPLEERFNVPIIDIEQQRQIEDVLSLSSSDVAKIRAVVPLVLKNLLLEMRPFVMRYAIKTIWEEGGIEALRDARHLLNDHAFRTVGRREIMLHCKNQGVHLASLQMPVLFVQGMRILQRRLHKALCTIGDDQPMVAGSIDIALIRTFEVHPESLEGIGVTLHQRIVTNDPAWEVANWVQTVLSLLRGDDLRRDFMIEILGENIHGRLSRHLQAFVRQSNQDDNPNLNILLPEDSEDDEDEVEDQFRELADQADLNDVEMQQMGNNANRNPIDFRIVGINIIPGDDNDDDGIAQIPEGPSNSNNDPNTLPNVPQNIQIEDGNIEEIPNELPHLHDDIQMEENEQVRPDVENREQAIHLVVDFPNAQRISNEARREADRLTNPLNEDGSTNEDMKCLFVLALGLSVLTVAQSGLVKKRQVLLPPSNVVAPNQILLPGQPTVAAPPAAPSTAPSGKGSPGDKQIVDGKVGPGGKGPVNVPGATSPAVPAPVLPGGVPGNAVVAQPIVLG
ncbi:hypothetical protein WR25_11664 [Diploscapter pachys]|uniref:Uncharacterized protein n=1 Tax=Diploscapter pachys TaxID=2018661 RepID=A0A2A2KQN1_9BILA|nr:hypothetical protein WR25_11664 [Diploscapter pachys]